MYVSNMIQIYLYISNIKISYWGIIALADINWRHLYAFSVSYLLIWFTLQAVWISFYFLVIFSSKVSISYLLKK